MEALAGSIALSLCGGALTARLIREFIPIFISRGHAGEDRLKKSPRPKIPEPMGVVTATVYLMVMFVFIPLPFYGWWRDMDKDRFPFHRFVEFLSGLMAITSMVLLGFADDMFDLRWRHKLLFPSLASLPLLMVYAANGMSTTILLPKQVMFQEGAYYYTMLLNL